tara:strand:+ start:155 stop:565 length:411 start_codon:yes stop_codon:yes gene_type:complete
MSVVWDEANGGFWQDTNDSFGKYEEGNLRTTWDELMNIKIGESVNFRLEEDQGEGKAFLKMLVVGYWTAQNTEFAIGMKHPHLILAGFNPEFRANDLNSLTDTERENLIEVIVYQGHGESTEFKIVSPKHFFAQLC